MSKLGVNGQIVDQYGRSFKTLRLSLTDACNFACTYCVDGVAKSVRKPKVSGTELANMVRVLHEVLAFDTVRFTGGEPLLYPDLTHLVQGLACLEVPLKITTNGYLLAPMAASLREAGLRSINVSLDALDRQVFQQMAQKDALETVLRGIEVAKELGLEVKLNTVVMKGVNETQILPLLEYGMRHHITIRFLELMRMGHLFSHQFDDFFFSQAQILEIVSAQYPIHLLPRQNAATANYWGLGNGYRFGIIANESKPFCHDCDRLRLDSFGNLYGCLSENQAVPMKGAMHDRGLLVEKLRLALAQKQPVKFIGSPLTMIGIGG